MIQIGWSHWNTGNVYFKVGQLQSYLKPENIRTRSHSKLKGSCGIATIICKAEIVVMAGWSWIFTGLERNNEALHAPQRTAGGTGILIPRQSSPHQYKIYLKFGKVSLITPACYKWSRRFAIFCVSLQMPFFNFDLGLWILKFNAELESPRIAQYSNQCTSIIVVVAWQRGILHV